ncbi:MAG: quinate 5-dehydrogenase, partial [Anaerolineae bacterium]|nr:quinate 5-dehydrogenase [Anaerolineae bacterium]
GLPHFRQAFIPLIVDRVGLGEAVDEVSEKIIIGDLMIALGIPIPLRSLAQYRKVGRVLLPIVSHFPMSMLFYGSGGAERKPRYRRFFEQSDVIAGDFLYMRKYMPESLKSKTIVTNTTTADDINLLRERGARRVITTTPRYEGRSFGTNMTEAMLTAYAGKGRRLDDSELNSLIDELDIRPTVQWLKK